MQDRTSGRHRSAHRLSRKLLIVVVVVVVSVLAGAGWAIAQTGDGSTPSGAGDKTAATGAANESGTVRPSERPVAAQPGRVSHAPATEPGDSAADRSADAVEPAPPPVQAPDIAPISREDREYTVGGGTGIHTPRTAVIDTSAARVAYHTAHEVRFLTTVRRAGLSDDLRSAPDDQLLGVGTDMCRMVQQFGGDPAAAELGLATAFRESGQAGLVGEGDRLLQASVRFLCPTSP